MAPWPHGDPDALARAIEAQPAYRVAPTSAKPPEPSLLEAFGDWLNHLLKPLFHWLEGAQNGSATNVLLSLALLGAVLAVVAFAIVRILDALSRGRGASASGPHAGRAGALAPARGAAEWRALAERAAAAGDYAAAIAALFSAALAALDERGLVPFDSARTPGEYRRVLRRAATLSKRARDSFDVLSECFVRAAFAGLPADGEAYARARSAYDGLAAPGA